VTKNTKLIIGVVVAIVLATGIIVMAVSGKNDNSKKQTENVLQNEPTIAPVDSSVEVSFKEGAKKGEALLTVKNAPSDTKDIEFTLSYDAESAANEESAGGTTQQGAVGNCVKNGSVWECGEPSTAGRKIVLGTCSSGVCRYHTLKSQVDVSLLFKGRYGERSFQKKYSL
jgi:hypothetical protein